MNALLERAASIREAEARDSAAFHDEQMQAYRAILARADSPLPEDAQNLITISDDLKLTPERVEADAKMVATFQRLSTEAAQLTERHAKMVAARATLKELVKTSQREILESEREVQKLGSHFSSSHAAAAEVQRMKSARPDLFPSATPTQEPSS
jgi:hypothetical protein